MWKIFVGVGIVGVGYSLNHSLPLKNPITKLLFEGLANKDEEHSKWVLGLLLKSGAFREVKQFKGKWLSEDFDIMGKIIREVEVLGFQGMTVGPVSFNEPGEGEAMKHLGVLYTKALARTYFEHYPDSPFKIGISIKPDEEVIKYTPYIASQNLKNSLDELGKDSPFSSIFINLSGIKKQLSPYSQQYSKLKAEIKTNCGELGSKNMSTYMEENQKWRNTSTNQILVDNFMTWKDIIEYIRGDD